MAKQLVIVGGETPSTEGGGAELLRLQSIGHYECCRWDSSGPRQLRSSLARLVIAWAVRESAWAVNFFEWLRCHPLLSPTLAVVAEDADSALVSLACDVADEFIFWPFRHDELLRRVKRLLGAPRQDVESVSALLARENALAQLVGRDPAIQRVVERIPLLAETDAPVLILGESGTGKELCARAVHHLSRRSNFPFIPVECGALPDHLVENELFGHARGAYTDARADQRGLAALAEGGTLFLDEIDALSIAAQVKVLRFLQDGTYRPLGSERFNQANVRLISASNCALEPLIRQEKLRSDLFFRLSVLQLHLPPLRERRGDIPLLANHFLAEFAGAHGRPQKTLTPGALRILEQHDWPGNVRELRNVIQQSLVFSSGPQILPSDFAFPFSTCPDPAATNFRECRRQIIEDFERRYVEELLRKHRGNVTRAAREAGKERRAFGRLARKYKIDRTASL
jgi:DNA-binding NtrC family response regulator